MKTRILIIAGLLLMTFGVKANRADAVFRTENGSPMVVFVNGQRINSKPSEVVKLDDIYAGSHRVKIKILGNSYTKELIKPINLRKGHRSVFVVNAGRRGHTSMVKIKEQPMLRNRQRPQSIRRGRGYYNGNHTFKNNHNQLNMDRFMQRLSYEAFDKDKVQVTKRALSERRIFARDLELILNEITFESNKLEVAMFAYESVIDKRNFHHVYDAFTFRSSIRKLEKYTYDSSRF